MDNAFERRTHDLFRSGRNREERVTVTVHAFIQDFGKELGIILEPDAAECWIMLYRVWTYDIYIDVFSPFFSKREENNYPVLELIFEGMRGFPDIARKSTSYFPVITLLT